MPEESAGEGGIGPNSLAQVCYEYLENRPFTTWGKSFNIKNPQSRKEAAEWLCRQVETVLQASQREGRSGAARHVELPT